jgi:trehalose 6-phosphate phosphatase
VPEPLPEPRTPAGRAGLAALLEAPRRALIAVDFDGTLAPIVADPAAARAHPRAPAALSRLAARVGGVAVVTGRPVEQALSLGDLAGVQGLVVLGHYGLERWADGTVTAPPPHPGVAAVRRELPTVLARHGEQAWVEDKGGSVAVHTRRAPDPAGLFAALREPLAELAARHGLTLEPGRFVLELRPPGVDKGAALRSLVRERDPSCVLFAGDDLGDLAAYDAVDELRAHGLPGLLVCSGSEEVVALAERADLVVAGPAGVVALFEALVQALDSA